MWHFSQKKDTRNEVARLEHLIAAPFSSPKNTPFLSSNIWKLQRNSMDSMKDFNNEEYKTGRDDVLLKAHEVRYVVLRTIHLQNQSAPPLENQIVPIFTFLSFASMTLLESGGNGGCVQ
jgi:hypothetical protein